MRRNPSLTPEPPPPTPTPRPTPPSAATPERKAPDNPSLRRAGTTAFPCGALAALLAFAVLPGLPHVIDGGALIASTAVGALTRHLRLRRLREVGRVHREAPRPPRR
ncbi:hypothetical protein [Streptomyces sp. NPDC097619]|uniref:hypothetical protein n=1 Tax=Streptomyces sp. NPDC097619 TaxID=3157228 RepID=UPI003331F6E4